MAVRVRVYERYIRLQAAHPRPVLTSALRVQSLFRMRRAKDRVYKMKQDAERDADEVASNRT